jgi:CBS domain-containing protein
MSKSNYEVCAEKKQVVALETTKSLEEAVELMRKRKGLMSVSWCKVACEIITTLYGLPYNEVDQLYEGKEQLVAAKTNVTLEEAIELLKERKIHMSDEGHESACEYISQLYGLIFEEINRAVAGCKYWIV